MTLVYAYLIIHLLHAGYGSSEAGLLCSTARNDSANHRSCGKLTPGVHGKVEIYYHIIECIFCIT